MLTNNNPTNPIIPIRADSKHKPMNIPIQNGMPIEIAYTIPITLAKIAVTKLFCCF